MGMVPDVNQHLSDDEDRLGGRQNKENSSIHSCSPEIRLETISNNVDDVMSVCSVFTGLSVESDSHTCKDVFSKSENCVSVIMNSSTQEKESLKENNSIQGNIDYKKDKALLITPITKPRVDKSDDVTLVSQESQKDVTEPTSDAEYSSNYEEDEDSDCDIANSLQNETATASKEMHTNENRDEDKHSVDTENSNARIQTYGSDSERDESLYNSNIYESDEYEDATESNRTDSETDSDTETKLLVMEKKATLHENIPELNSSLRSNGFRDKFRLNKPEIVSSEKQSEINIQVNELYSKHTVHQTEQPDSLDNSRVEGKPMKYHSDDDTDTASDSKDVNGHQCAKSTDYDDDFDSESDKSSQYGSKSDSNVSDSSKTSDNPALHDVENWSNLRYTSVRNNDIEIDTKNKMLKTSTTLSNEIAGNGKLGTTVSTKTASIRENNKIGLSDQNNKEPKPIQKPLLTAGDNKAEDGKHQAMTKTSRPISSRSEIVIKASSVKFQSKKGKLLRKRSGSLPNKIKENIPVPSRQNLYKAPKDIHVNYSNDRKRDKTNMMQKAPLPLINTHCEKTNSDTDSLNLKHSRVQSLVKENKLTLEEDRISHVGGTLLNRTDVQHRPLSARSNVHHNRTLNSKPTNDSTTTGTNVNVRNTSGSTANQPQPLSDKKTHKNINDFTDQLIKINNQSCKDIGLTIEEFEDMTLETSISSTASTPGSNTRLLHPDKEATCFTGTEAIYTIGEGKGIIDCKIQIKDTIGDKPTNFTYSSHDSSSSVQKQVELKSEEMIHNQYSISTASDLTRIGNDTSKSFTDKTNTTEYFITGNELISPLASSEERKHGENNNFAMKLKGEAIKDSAVDYASSESHESADSMEDANDSKLVKNKGLRQGPVNRNLYRSHTRPRSITTKTESKTLKYGMERPSSPFIFSGAKSYIRQTSLTSDLQTYNEDGSNGDLQERRQTKTGLADIARLRDIRRQLRLPEEISSDAKSEHTDGKQKSGDTEESGMIAKTKTKYAGRLSSAGKPWLKTIVTFSKFDYFF